MKNVKGIHLISLFLVGVFILSSCAGTARYELDSVYSDKGDESKMTIGKLLENYDDYDVFYREDLMIIAFDPKDDGKNMTMRTQTRPDFDKVDDARTFTEVLIWQHHMRSQGRVYRVLGANDELFGYTYHVHFGLLPLVTEILDDTTVNLYGDWYPAYYSAWPLEKYVLIKARWERKAERL